MEVILLIKTVSKLSPPVCRSGSTASLPRATLDRFYIRIPRTTMDRFYIRNIAPLEHSSFVRKTAEKTVGPGNRTGCNILGRYYGESERSIYAGQEERAAGDDTGMKTEGNVDDALVVDHAA